MVGFVDQGHAWNGVTTSLSVVGDAFLELGDIHDLNIGDAEVTILLKLYKF